MLEDSFLGKHVFLLLNNLLNMYYLFKWSRIGAESLAVAQNNYAVLWFKGKELNTVFGLQLSFARVGSTVNFWVMGPIYNWAQQVFSGFEGLGLALFIGK